MLKHCICYSAIKMETRLFTFFLGISLDKIGNVRLMHNGYMAMHFLEYLGSIM